MIDIICDHSRVATMAIVSAVQSDIAEHLKSVTADFSVASVGDGFKRLIITNKKLPYYHITVYLYDNMIVVNTALNFVAKYSISDPECLDKVKAIIVSDLCTVPFPARG